MDSATFGRAVDAARAGTDLDQVARSLPEQLTPAERPALRQAPGRWEVAPVTYRIDGGTDAAEAASRPAELVLPATEGVNRRRWPQPTSPELSRARSFTLGGTR